MRPPDAKDIKIFRPDEGMVTPAQVVFYILETAAREKQFGVAGTQTLWYHTDTLEVLDEYIKRLME